MIPMSILLKGNVLLTSVSACSFGTPNSANFCSEFDGSLLLINGSVIVLWNRIRDIFAFCFLIISHPVFSFQLDSLESHGSSGQSPLSYIVLPMGQYRLLISS